MSERPHVCYDRFLPDELMRHQPTQQRHGRTRAISPKGKTWINGSTLRVRFIDGTPAQQDIARRQAKWWSDVANLKFDFNNAPDAEIRIRFNPGDGAWSYVGTDAKRVARNEATMNLGFLDGGTAAHEFGHAIGLAHEHQNPAGGIQWNEATVIREMAKSPNFWDERTTRHNILRRYSADQINGTEFDPQSIMLYFFPAAWTLNGIGTRANEVLSGIDKSFIAGAKMYPKTGPTPTTAPRLNVNARTRTRASIGKGGEEDLYVFTVTKEGMHIIDTQGPTDVVMKLFGPDHETALLAMDDDSGTALNARISADLIAGDYYVQIRHYQPRTGTGDYSIRVRRP